MDHSNDLPTIFSPTDTTANSILSDETASDHREMILFPTYAFRNPQDPSEWLIRVKGWALSHNRSVAKERVVMGLTKSLAGKSSADHHSTYLFEQRFKYFLAKNKRNKQFVIHAVGAASVEQRLQQRSDEENDNHDSNFVDEGTTDMALEAIVPYFSTSRRSSAESSDSGYNSGFQSDSGNKQFYEDSPKQDDEYAQDYDSIFSDNFQRDPILVDRPGNPLSTIFNGSRQKYSYLTPSSVSIASGSTSSSSFDNENTVQSFDTMTSTASFSNVDMQASSPISLTTETSGFLSGELALPHHIVSSWTKNDDHCGTRVVHLRSSGESTFASSYGDVSMIEPEGVSIISDIDDTIKDTQILAGAKKVLSNTFFRRAKAVHGMAETYMEWYHNGASFHYVSNSPFQLTTMLEEFLKDANFPPGSMHLRLDGSLLARLVEVPGRAKRDAIIALLKDFPRRKFVLIGDSGEIDLEIYARIAADFPGRILKVMIRDVSTPQTLVRRRTTWGSIFSPSKQQHQQEIPPQQQRSASDSALLPTCDALDQRLEKARRLCPHTEMIVFQNANVLKNDSVVREALWRALDQQRPHAPL